MENREENNIINDEKNEKTHRNQKIKKTWMWIISIFCIMSGIIFAQDIIVPSILILLAGIILLPPVDEIIKEKINEQSKRKLFGIMRIIYTVIALMVISVNISNVSSDGSIYYTEKTNNGQSENILNSTEILGNISAIDQNTINETLTNIIAAENGKYDGDIVNGKMQGKGTYEWNDGSKYVGDFNNNKINGRGTLTIPKKGSYEGDFVEGKKSGKGTYKFANGDVYEGDWSDDKMSGKGTYTFDNGEKYVGDFKNNKFNGKGTYSKNGKVYTGTWKDNQYTK